MSGPCPEDCIAHSGIKEVTEALKSFQDRQEGTDGVNQRMWETYDKINSKQNWLLGGISLLSFEILAGIAILLELVKK